MIGRECWCFALHSPFLLLRKQPIDRERKLFVFIKKKYIFCCFPAHQFSYFPLIRAADTCCLGHFQGVASIPEETGCHIQNLQKDSCSYWPLQPLPRDPWVTSHKHTYASAVGGGGGDVTVLSKDMSTCNWWNRGASDWWMSSSTLASVENVRSLNRWLNWNLITVLMNRKCLVEVWRELSCFFHTRLHA